MVGVIIISLQGSGKTLAFGLPILHSILFWRSRLDNL